MSDSFETPRDCSPPGSSVHGISQSNTGVGCRFLLQGIFPRQVSNPCLLHWQLGSCPLSHQGSPGKYTATSREVEQRIPSRGPKPILSHPGKQTADDSDLPRSHGEAVIKFCCSADEFATCHCNPASPVIASIIPN